MNMVDVAIFLEPGSTAVLSDKWGTFTTSDHSLDSDLRLFGPPIFVRWFDSLLNISKIRGPRALLKDAHSENTTFGGQDGSRWVKMGQVCKCNSMSSSKNTRHIEVDGCFPWLFFVALLPAKLPWGNQVTTWTGDLWGCHWFMCHIGSHMPQKWPKCRCTGDL